MINLDFVMFTLVAGAAAAAGSAAGAAGLISGAGGLLATIYKIIYGERAWKKMSPSAKEQLDYEDEINDDNATLAYKREREFQESYLSPAAQLQSLAAGYQAVGINKMALAGSQPGATASTAPQAASPSAGSAPGLPSGIGEIFGQLLDYSVNKKRTDNEYKLRERGLEIEQERLDMLKGYYSGLNRLNLARSIGAENENSIFGLKKEDLEQNIALKKANQAQIVQWIEESASNIYVNNERASKLFAETNYLNVQAAGQAIQNMILEAQSKYSDRFYKALANYQEAQATVAQFDSAAVKRFFEKKMKAYEAQLEGMILDTRQSKEWLDSAAWKATCEGKMTTAERTQFWGNVVGGVVRTGLIAGAGVAGAGIAASARAAGSFQSSLWQMPNNMAPSLNGAPITLYR